MKIKIISLWNPWAFAMWAGLKQYETRPESAPVVSQLRSYGHGWLGIHAAKLPMMVAIGRSFGNDANSCEAWLGWFLSYAKDVPLSSDYGVLGGICRFSGIFQTQQIEPKLSEMERFFGNYEAGRRALFCPGMVRLPTPIPMRGFQGAWNWDVPREVEELLKAQPAEVPR
jgi:hypothetical protein